MTENYSGRFLEEWADDWITDELAMCFSHYDVYEGIGFRKLEVFPTLWDEWNPCLVLVKSVTPLDSNALLII